MLAYKKILVPVDFAKISFSSISQAAKHSESSNSALLVVHVVDRPAAENSSESVREQSKLVNEAEQRLDQLLDSLEIGYCEKIVKVGDTVPTLLDVIQEQDIDLVVMGTHISDEAPAWIKSITVEVVTHTDCDVLVLHK